MDPGTTSAPDARTVETLDIVSGSLALDLANTVDGRRGSHPWDRLRSVDDVLRWAHRAGLIDHAALAAFRATLVDRPGQEDPGCMKVFALREACYRVFAAIAMDATPAEPDLDHLRAEFAEAVPAAHLVDNGATWQWAWDMPHSVAQVAWPVASAAIGLLQSDRLHRIAICGGADSGDVCGGLFIDETKAGNRKWCTANGCGARARWRRQNRKRRAQRGSEASEPT